MIRLARPEDREALRKLCAEKPYYDSEFMSADQLREFTLMHFEAHFEKAFTSEEGCLLVATPQNQPVGYAALVFHTTETITQESQTLLFDFAVPGFDVLQPLVEECKRQTARVRDQYLVVHLQEPGKREQLWYYRLGFRPELNRVVRHIAAGHVGPASPRYRARPARVNDHLFLLRVNAEYSALYRPAGRDTDLQAVRAGFLAAYADLNLKDPHSHYIILEDVEKGRPAGYIILLEHQLPVVDYRAYYTYDVAVAPEYAGRGLSLYLCGAGETLLGSQGGGVIFGDTSLDNVGAVNGDRALGFIVDSKRWGLDCRMLPFCESLPIPQDS